MKKVTSTIYCLLFTTTLLVAQHKDSLSVEIGEQSNIIFNIDSENDLETIKQIDFQELVNDVVDYLEDPDSNAHAIKSSNHYITVIVEEKLPAIKIIDEPAYPDGDDHTHHHDPFDDEFFWEGRIPDIDWEARRIYEFIRLRKKKKNENYRHTFNLDIGLNNYHASGSASATSDLQTVKPWGSWTVGMMSNHRNRISKRMLTDFGIGVNWDNYKFENPRTTLSKVNNQLVFAEDSRDGHYIKSKLSAFYLTAHFMPVFSAKGEIARSSHIDGTGKKGFQIGVGPFFSYRVSSRTKLVYKDGSGREKEKKRGSYYLNNLQYGVKVYMGIGKTGFFFKYAINPLFSTPQGPDLNAYSFGISF